VTTTTKPTAKDRPVYVLQFRAGPDCVDAIRSLRALLKVAKRQLKLQCVSARERTEEQP